MLIVVEIDPLTTKLWDMCHIRSLWQTRWQYEDLAKHAGQCRLIDLRSDERSAYGATWMRGNFQILQTTYLSQVTDLRLLAGCTAEGFRVKWQNIIWQKGSARHILLWQKVLQASEDPKQNCFELFRMCWTRWAFQNSRKPTKSVQNRIWQKFAPLAEAKQNL